MFTCYLYVDHDSKHLCMVEAKSILQAKLLLRSDRTAKHSKTTKCSVLTSDTCQCSVPGRVTQSAYSVASIG